jgi:hypothetical protein
MNSASAQSRARNSVAYVSSRSYSSVVVAVCSWLKVSSLVIVAASLKYNIIIHEVGYCYNLRLKVGRALEYDLWSFMALCWLSHVWFECLIQVQKIYTKLGVCDNSWESYVSMCADHVTIFLPLTRTGSGSVGAGHHLASHGGFPLPSPLDSVLGHSAIPCWAHRQCSYICWECFWLAMIIITLVFVVLEGSPCNQPTFRVTQYDFISRWNKIFNLLNIAGIRVFLLFPTVCLTRMIRFNESICALMGKNFLGLNIPPFTAY